MKLIDVKVGQIIEWNTKLLLRASDAYCELHDGYSVPLRQFVDLHTGAVRQEHLVDCKGHDVQLASVSFIVKFK